MFLTDFTIIPSNLFTFLPSNYLSNKPSNYLYPIKDQCPSIISCTIKRSKFGEFAFQLRAEKEGTCFVLRDFLLQSYLAKEMSYF